MTRKEKTQSFFAVFLLTSVTLFTSYWFLKRTYYPEEALAVAQLFTDDLANDQLERAYALVDRTSRIAPSIFSTLDKFKEYSLHNNPRIMNPSGEIKISSFWPTESNARRIGRWLKHSELGSTQLSVDFNLEFEVRLCHQTDQTWKVCYFQTHDS